MNFRLTALALATCLVPSLGCDVGGACTDIAIASVSLRVVDAETQEAIPMTMITFTVDGDPEVRDPVDQFDGDFVLAYEEVGTFEVTVVADGYRSTTEEYVIEMDEDGCHPDGITDTIELAAL